MPRANGSNLCWILSSLLLLSSTTPSALALGDFPCSGSADSQSCAAWSVDPNAQGPISATAVCQPDPANPAVSYCGYASATCTTKADCDYGSCGSTGTCKGYLGDPCPGGNTDCEAFFFCGTDGTCGGVGASCANGDPSSPIPSPNQQCTSNSCDTVGMVCNAPPAAGVALGSACGTNAICASGWCSSNLCATRLAASPASGKKVKRYVLNGSGPNVESCPSGQRPCAVGTSLSEGFECIDSNTNLEQCGGCVTDGQGEDCTMIHGVESVECQSGSCAVLSCRYGMQPSYDAKSCVSAY